ncbi:MAG: TrkA family potassium uptake protein [Euryarchaeota archaeon]|nr:TrkA family potassium uptake protein [Euryarchaeota archaeon]
MYLVVVGLGPVGRHLVEFAIRKKHNVAAVDRDKARCQELASRVDALTIVGDATYRRILEEAGAPRADAVIATTGIDAVNFMVCLLARELGVKNLVSVLNNPEHTSMFDSASIHLIENSDMDVARRLYWAVERPNVRDLFRFGEGKVEIFEVGVLEGSEASGRELSELKIADVGHVVAIERKNKVIIPKGDTEIQAGDKVTVISQSDAVERITQMLTGRK